jgi:hypothetical protein
MESVALKDNRSGHQATGKNAAMTAKSGGEVAAGDGLGAFGAALILPVQMHFKAGSAIALQWIEAKQSLALAARQAIRARIAISLKCSFGRTAAGEQPCPPPHYRPRGAEGGCRRLERVDSQTRSTGLTVAMAKAPCTGCQKLV